MTGSASTRGPARALAAALCVVHAVVLAGLGGFYAFELAVGAGSDPPRVAVSAVLILLVAVSLAVLGWMWWTGSRRPTVPTLIWNGLLVPVALGLVQAGELVLGVLLAGLVAATVAATVGAAAGAAPQH